MSNAIPAREFNRRIKRAIRELRAAGAERLAVEILPDGGARVVEGDSTDDSDEAARVARLIEDRMGGHA